MLGKNFKKLQEHITVLKERETHKVLQVEELLKLNEGLQKVRKENEVEAKALRKELEQVKGELE